MPTLSWSEASDQLEAALRHERVNFSLRSRMLYREDYRWLDHLARDLRNGDPFDMNFLHAKRDYQWAVNAWLFGRLTASEFRLRSSRFEITARMAFAREDAGRKVLAESANRTGELSWKKWIRRCNNDGFVSRAGWTELQALEERNTQWLVERQRRQELHRQRTRLREGHATMKAIRRVLRGQDPLPRQESTPEKSSPTS